jgi:hypothetical protein
VRLADLQRGVYLAFVSRREGGGDDPLNAKEEKAGGRRVVRVMDITKKALFDVAEEDVELVLH